MNSKNSREINGADGTEVGKSTDSQAGGGWGLLQVLCSLGYLFTRGQKVGLRRLVSELSLELFSTNFHPHCKEEGSEWEESWNCGRERVFLKPLFLKADTCFDFWQCFNIWTVFPRQNIIFQKKRGRRTTKICLSSTLSLPPQPSIVCCLQNNRQRPRKSPQKYPRVEQSLPPSRHHSSLGCSTDTTDGLALKSKRPQHAVLTFSFEILIAGLDPKPSDIWPFPTSVTCQNPEQPQLCFPTQGSPPSSQLVRDVGLGSQESKERRP